jgi:hypothetical protein
MIRITSTLLLLTLLLGCGENIQHDTDLAARRAVEFADTVFVRQNMEKGYMLLAAETRSYVPFNKFEETATQVDIIHTPSKIAVVGAAPVTPSETLVNVVLACDGTDGRTYKVTVTLKGTKTSDYQVTKFVRWAVPLVPSG